MKYSATQVFKPLASDAGLLGTSAIFAVAAISSAAILRGMDGVLIATAFTTINGILSMILLKRLSHARRKR